MDSSLLKKLFRGAAVLLLLLPLSAGAWIRSPATTFATLPEGATNPEGIAVGPGGNVFVSTFAVGGTESGVGEIFVFNNGGQLIRKVAVAGSSAFLLELGFHPVTGDLLVIDFGNQQVLDVDPLTGASSLFATIPGGANAGPNVLTFDSVGNVYISDSFQGIVWKTDQNGIGDAPGVPSVWVQNALLITSGAPPFGANGIAFNNDESALFVSNTGNDTVVKVPVDEFGNSGAPEVFVNSVNGADGLIIDEDDNLWIAANQSDEIVVVNPDGRAIAKLGDFGGLSKRGAPVGLLFPASLVRHGKYIYVTNLALDLRLFGLAPPINAIWAGEVTTHTISKIRARIPPVNGLP